MTLLLYDIDDDYVMHVADERVTRRNEAAKTTPLTHRRGEDEAAPELVGVAATHRGRGVVTRPVRVPICDSSG